MNIIRQIKCHPEAWIGEVDGVQKVIMISRKDGKWDVDFEEKTALIADSFQEAYETIKNYLQEVYGQS